MRYSGRRRRPRRTGRLVILSILILCGVWAIYSRTQRTTDTDESAIQAMDAGQPTRATAVAPVEVKTAKEPELTLLAATAGKKPVTSQPVEETVCYDAPPPHIEKILIQSQQLFDRGRMIEARKVLNDYLKDHFHDPDVEPIRQRALELGRRTILTSKIYDGDPLCQNYQVRSGDVLDRIARNHRVPYQFLCRINGIADPGRLRVGQNLKVVHGPIHVKVVSRELRAYVFLNDTLFAIYDVGLGKENRDTPTGKWLVEDRVKNPDYVDPDTSKFYAGNDPDNPTGGYWIRLKGIEGDTIGKTGFGLHGTTEPESIGQFMSKGCIRFRNNEMAEVFDMLTTGFSHVYTLP